MKSNRQLEEKEGMCAKVGIIQHAELFTYIKSGKELRK